MLILLVSLMLLPAKKTYAAFPGKNGQVAYTTLTIGDHSTMPALNSTLFSGGQEQVLNPTNFLYSPRYSADGTKLTVSGSTSIDDSATSNIYVMNSDGSGLRNVTNINQANYPNMPQYQAAYSSFNKDGDKIAYTAFWEDGNNNNRSRIHVINQDGTGDIQLTDPADNTCDVYPVFSPDSSKIAYVHSSMSGRTSSIFIMDQNGQNQHKILDIDTDYDDNCLDTVDSFQYVGFAHSAFFEGRGVSSIDWSPDGSKLVYSHGTSTVDGDRTEFEDNLYTSDLEGNVQKISTADGLQDNGVAQNAQNDPPENMNFTALLNPQFTPEGGVIYKKFTISIPYKYDNDQSQWMSDEQNAIILGSIYADDIQGGAERQVVQSQPLHGQAGFSLLYSYILPSVQPITIPPHNQSESLASTGQNPALYAFTAVTILCIASALLTSKRHNSSRTFKIKN